MRTKTRKKSKVHVVTMGCSKNLYDSEVLMGQLSANRIPVEHETGAGDAEVVVINTCGFIESAKQESIDEILRWADQKKKGKIDKVIVTGCLSERYREELEKGIPEVDAYFGTSDLPRLLKTLGADYKKELVGERLVTTPRHYAYLKISEGCDRPCSFCAIPLMRGKHRSTPIEDIVSEAKRLAAVGTRELLLIAQDSTMYGLDLYGKRRLADLLRALSDVEGIGWIRIHYAFPAGFPDDILEAMRERKNICNYLDMPIQHASTRMLESMKRGSTRRGIEDLIARIRDRVPGIALRTTLIAGYPGETEADHAELADFLRRTRFDRLGVFEYSHEENTGAFALADDVSSDDKRRRADALMAIQRDISLEINRAQVGKTIDVLIDREDGKHWVARSERDSPEVDNEVLIDAGSRRFKPGQFLRVRVVAASEYDLSAVPA